MTYTFTGNIKKYPTALLLLIFMCATLFAPVMVMAGHEPIGTPCSSSIGGGDHCRSGDCEDSSKDIGADDFCDCNDDNDCKLEYGQANPNVTSWECWDGAHATYDLDYCVGTIPGSKSIVKYPIDPPRDPSFVDKLLDPQITLDEIQKKISTPQPRITIPGLEFSKAQAVMDRGKTYMIFPFLGEYIAAIYRYAVVVASALAVLVIIVSGIQWMLPGNLLTSGEGDSTQTTNQAKKRIGGALVGLTIAVGSYTILYLVNPELVKFKNLRVLLVDEIGLDRFNENVTDEPTPTNIQSHSIVVDTTGQQVNPQNLGYGFNNVPYFAQFDGRWGKLRFGAEARCSSYTEAGCGPSAFAMVLKHLKKAVNPTHIGKIAIETQARSCPGGTNSRNKEFLKKIEKDYGVKISIITDRKKALQLLNGKTPLIVSGPSSGQNNKNTTRTYKGHFLVLTGVDNKKQIEDKDIIRVNDPGNRAGRRSITHMSMSQFNKKNRFILIESNTPSATPTP